jgi:hypothetical protein
MEEIHMEVYAVIWATGSCDDHGSAHTYNGIHGIYKTEARAKQGLEECKEEIYNDVLNDLDPDGEFYRLREDVQVYGSVADGHFEIVYTLGTEPVEVYIQITHNYVQD